MLGGVLAGNCMVPLSFMRRWRWENVWIVFSLVALILLPWSLGLLRVPHLLLVYGSVPLHEFVRPVLFGAGWGVAQVLFGLAVMRIGMALSFAITIGLGAALGTLVPIVLQHPAALATDCGRVLLLGVLMMVAGVGVCSWAGRRREREQNAGAAREQGGMFLSGIALAAVSGLLAPMLNYSLAFANIFIEEALRHHAAIPDAPYAVWPIALAGGAVPNLAYAGWLVTRNQTWANFFPLWPQVLTGIIMGVLWIASIAAYGTSTTLLGELGASIGWSVYQIFVIFTASISGWIAGEWREVSMPSRLAQWGGLCLLGFATLAMTYGNR